MNEHNSTLFLFIFPTGNLSEEQSNTSFNILFTVWTQHIYINSNLNLNLKHGIIYFLA